MERLPVVYVRGYAGPTSGIDTQVDDPFYGFNEGSTHVRVDGDGDPRYYQFAGPLLRLMNDENYRLLVGEGQRGYLEDASDDTLPKNTLWIHRFYDEAASTFKAPEPEGVLSRLWHGAERHLSAHFDIERAAADLLELVLLVRAKTGAPRVFLVAHSMGGLVCRCMIQKLCPERRKPARDLVERLFTYGTPHAGIDFEFSPLDWAQEVLGPAGSDIFSPAKMYGYLTPGARFGDEPPEFSGWDPHVLPEENLPPERVFCLIGTNPRDYGPVRAVVGPKSDGLVRVERAYVKGAHRAYVHRSHSGRYGEVNSEEGYQNLRRFLLGRYEVRVRLAGLAGVAQSAGSSLVRSSWQADMRLTIRGLPVVVSEQQAAHWCPIQLQQELAASSNGEVTLLGFFMVDPAREADLARERGGDPAPVRHGGRARYSLTVSLYRVTQRRHGFAFADHLEQVPDWSDVLVTDVGPAPDGSGLAAWAAWNSDVPGPIDAFDPIGNALAPGSDGRLGFASVGPGTYNARVELPDVARNLPVLGKAAHLVVEVLDRDYPVPEPATAV